MARPRKHIGVKQRPDGTWQRLEKGGTEVPGVSYHKSTGQFYTIHEKGQRVYLGPHLPPVVKKYLLGETDLTVRSVTALQRLKRVGVASDILEKLPQDSMADLDQMTTWQVPGLVEWIEAHKDQDPSARSLYNDMMVKTGFPEKQLHPIPSEKDAEPQQEPSRQRLRDVINLWARYRNEENCQETYVKDVCRVFDRFIKHIGNKSISDLSADDFARWRRWIIRNSKGKSNKWINDHNKQVQTVLTAAKQEKPSWPFPDGIKEWMSSWKTRKHIVEKSNRRVLFVDAFRALIAVALKWQQVDTESYSKDTQRGRAQRLQAQRKREEGLRWEAILRLAVNCALGNVDCRTIRWEHLKLGDPLPHMDFPRKKVEKTTGAAVDRLTPLLPSTVRALKAYRAIQPYDGVVFRTARGGPFSHNGFRRAFRNLAEQAGVEGFTFKHIRNIAPHSR